MSELLTVKVLDFTEVPGARTTDDGDGSAQEFFEKHLKDKLSKALEGPFDICIDFDGTYGYASSFISELAKRIVTTFDRTKVGKILQIKSDDEPSLIARFENELKKNYRE